MLIPNLDTQVFHHSTVWTWLSCLWWNMEVYHKHIHECASGHSWSSCVHFTLSNTICLRCILILSICLYLGLSLSRSLPFRFCSRNAIFWNSVICKHTLHNFHMCNMETVPVFIGDFLFVLWSDFLTKVYTQHFIFYMASFIANTALSIWNVCWNL